MASHSSVTAREETPHATQTSHGDQTTRTATIITALTQRAQAVLNDKSIDAQTRAIIRYGLETNDPWLADLVRRADASESIVETLDVSQTSDCSQTPETFEPVAAGPTPNDDYSSKEKIEALAEIICRGGDESAAALFVLMATLVNSTQPKALANTAKHFAFTRCGELNLYGIVDAQIAVLEGELLAGQ